MSQSKQQSPKKPMGRPPRSLPSLASAPGSKPSQLDAQEPMERVTQRRNLWRLIQAPTGHEDIDYGNLLNIWDTYYDHPARYVADIPISHHPELKEKLVPVKNNDPSPQPESYHDLATWMWFMFVKWLEDGGVLPYDDELCAQLATREFEWHFQHGRMSRKLVSKKDNPKTRQKSPDRAEAVILAAIAAPKAVVAYLSQADMDANDQARLSAAIAKAALQPRRVQREAVLKDQGPEERRPNTIGLRSRREARQSLAGRLLAQKINWRVLASLVTL